MSKLFAISNPKTKQHLGSIIADRVEYDSLDKYWMFMIGTKTVAMFPGENIEISTADSRSQNISFQGFTEYQSNRL